MWMFLVTDAMTFGGLLLAYGILRIGNPHWPPPTTVLGAPARDRQWRLTATNGTVTQPPALRVGYRPEVVVFLAQGRAPYALVAGSAVAARADAPLPRLLQSLRTATPDDATRLEAMAVVGVAGRWCARRRGVRGQPVAQATRSALMRVTSRAG